MSIKALLQLFGIWGLRREGVQVEWRTISLRARCPWLSFWLRYGLPVWHGEDTAALPAPIILPHWVVVWNELNYEYSKNDSTNVVDIIVFVNSKFYGVIW